MYPVVIPPLPPSIEWPGYRLRGLQPDDAAGWYRILSVAEVTEHTSFPPQTPESVGAMVEHCIAEYAAASSCRWALAGTADDALIGTCGFNRWSPELGWAELAYELAPGRWGAGLMSEAVRRAVRWSFRDAGFVRVHALTCDTNERSARLLERVGFTREGLLRSFRPIRGVPRDYWMYSILRSEFLPSAPSGSGAPAR